MRASDDTEISNDGATPQLVLTRAWCNAAARAARVRAPSRHARILIRTRIPPHARLTLPAPRQPRSGARRHLTHRTHRIAPRQRPRATWHQIMSNSAASPVAPPALQQRARSQEQTEDGGAAHGGASNVAHFQQAGHLRRRWAARVAHAMSAQLQRGNGARRRKQTAIKRRGAVAGGVARAGAQRRRADELACARGGARNEPQ